MAWALRSKHWYTEKQRTTFGAEFEQDTATEQLAKGAKDLFQGYIVHNVNE